MSIKIDPYDFRRYLKIYRKIKNINQEQLCKYFLLALHQNERDVIDFFISNSLLKRLNYEDWENIISEIQLPINKSPDISKSYINFIWGYLYYYGAHINYPCNFQKAIEFYTEDRDFDFPGNALYLAKIYLISTVDYDKKLAAKYLEIARNKAHEKGHNILLSEIEYYLGLLCEMDDKKDYSEAFKYFLSSAKKNFRESIRKIIEYYYEKKKIEINKFKVVAYYQKYFKYMKYDNKMMIDMNIVETFLILKKEISDDLFILFDDLSEKFDNLQKDYQILNRKIEKIQDDLDYLPGCGKIFKLAENDFKEKNAINLANTD